MKQFLILIAVFTVTTVSQIGAAWSSSDEADVVVESTKVEIPKAEATNGDIHLFLKGERVVVLPLQPDLEQMKKSLGLVFPDDVQKKILEQGGSVTDQVDPLESWKNLSESQKVVFEHKRISYLTMATAILNRMDRLIGLGMISSDGVGFLVKNAKRVVGKKTETENSEKLQLSERKKRFIEGVLQGIDYKLFSQAPLVVNSNEFGMQMAAGVIGLSGFMKKGGGGVEEMGLSLSMNAQTKTVVFEVFHSSERFSFSALPVINIGVNGKAGILLTSRDLSQPEHTLKGVSFYPPMIPGFSTSGPEFFATGGSSGLGFPPPPLADMLTFQNKFERNMVLRITVSPIHKGFVRLQVGSLKRPFQLMAYRFLDVYNAIREKVISRGRISCQQVFAVP